MDISQISHRLEALDHFAKNIKKQDLTITQMNEIKKLVHQAEEGIDSLRDPKKIETVQLTPQGRNMLLNTIDSLLENREVVEGAGVISVLFWNHLEEFQTLLQPVNDRHLKRGERVSKIDDSSKTK